MELKDTLLMMETNFEMRGNLNIKEPLLVKKWADEKVYNKMNEDQPLGEYMAHHMQMVQCIVGICLIVF